uniref:Uncharacterized protein n=1 Tax=Ficus carica TaxID=3494 RepID=A0AA87Z5V8_FICCA|nr:hypothetical protein TIFTF001_049916 [Ficus carica]GMN19511.1 hypothetical protein TIFTF001_049921 [Ficus carica]
MIWIDPPISKSSYANEELMMRLEIIEDAILRVDEKLDFKDLDIFNLKQELVKKEEEIVKIGDEVGKYKMFLVVCMLIVVPLFRKF